MYLSLTFFAIITYFLSKNYLILLVTKEEMCIRDRYKSRCTGFLNARRAPLKKTENILVFYQKLPLYNPQFEQGKPYKRSLTNNGDSPNYGKFVRTTGGSEDGLRFPGNVLTFPTVQRTVHPTQKPVALCEYFIKTYTRPGAVSYTHLDVYKRQTVRPEKDGKGYEIIAGHRRHHGGTRAGLEEMPCIVREMTDLEAVREMRNSNKQRGDPLPSELAKLLDLEVEAIKRQGARPKTEKEAEALGKLSVEIVGKDHDMNYKKVIRYIRLNSLVPERCV